MTDDAALMSVASVAARLDCSPWTVRRRIHAGELQAVNDHGRLAVRAEDLRAYIDALERVGAPTPGRARARPARRTYDYLR
jgi:excisionase family DNA binding protein